MTYAIPFNRASFTGKEVEYMIEAVANGHISGDGPFTRRCHARLAELLEGGQAFLTTSCTHALELAALTLEIGAGDEVILPSFTFVSTANAFVLRGARPIFADVRPDTLNLDEGRLEALFTEHTRAVVPVHYAGVGCAMETIDALARERGSAVVEDNAHGFLGRYQNRPLGRFGAMATLSFHETKNITCGEGGALVVNDPALVPRAEILREKGTDRAQFFRGEIDKYTWRDLGSSYLPSDILAAFLLAQLETADEIQADRRRVWSFYAERLGPWAARAGVRLPVVPEGCEQSFHMFYLLCPTPERRSQLLAGMKERGILATFHYVPLHLSAMGRRYGYRPGDLPHTEDVAARLVRLPFFRSLDEAGLEEVVEAVLTIGRRW